MPVPPRVAVTALGCKVNVAEMADLAGALAAAGCEIVREEDDADVCVLNSCTVTLQADATTRQRLRRLRREHPRAHLVLTGCSVDANPGRYAAAAPVDGVDAVFDNAAKPRIAEHVLALFGGGTREPRDHAPLRSRAFVKVQDGCRHACSYCIVTVARGDSRSLPLAEAVARVRRALDAGHREVVLTGVDLGAYGRDQGTSLAGLVRVLLDGIGDARLRLSSVNANDVTTELAELNGHPRLCAHWHLPLQSGSDAVLRAMRRGYRRAQFERVVARLRAADPDTELTTDIMTAFPGETEDDHRRTLALVEECGFLHCHVFRWSPRPGTAATTLGGRVDDATAHRRSRELRRAAARSGGLRRAAAVGRVHEVVWDRVEAGVAHGVAATWHTVVAPASAASRPGGMERVRADGADAETLRGTIVEEDAVA